jgi:UDP-N-acetylmuramate-alanine ligase
VVYQDYACNADKVKSSIHAVKEQFPNQKLVTIIELNSYDSLEFFLFVTICKLDERVGCLCGLREYKFL